MQTISYYQSPVGRILLASDDQGLTGLWLASERFYADNLTEHQLGQTPVLNSIKKWLDQYFSGQKTTFTPPLHPNGTPFQLMVWQLLLKIPYGHTTTYAELAQQAAQKHHLAKMSAQAVGNAVGRNHIALIIPCHRVVGSNGNLTGYGGGIDKKIQLLKLEGLDMMKFSMPK